MALLVLARSTFNPRLIEIVVPYGLLMGSSTIETSHLVYNLGIHETRRTVWCGANL